MNYLFKLIFHLLGWKVQGNIPTVKKSLFVVSPHASTWDFPLGIITRAALGVKISYLGKKELFDSPFGFLFKWLDGFPVDRSSRTNFVQSVVDLYKNNEVLHLAIAPEGTRKPVEKLKTGFYYMAHNSKIPMIFVGFEYPTRTILVSEPYYTTGDKEADLKHIAQHFLTVKGVHKAWIANYLEGKF